MVSIIYIENSLAFGIVSPYFDGRNFLIAPGQVKSAELILQNMVGDEDVRIRTISVKDGDGIADIPEQAYLVPAKTSDTIVPITIRIPENAPIGAKYEVVVGFETTNNEGGGAVSLGTGIETKFIVEVVSLAMAPEIEPQKPAYRNTIIAVIVLVVLALIVWFIIRRKKRINKN